MEIYVQSCGVAQEHDYRWLKIPQEGEPHLEIPRILREASRIEKRNKVRITDLYESQDPSIVMARDKGELLLLVTALDAVDRTRIYGRQVRNSVAWVTQESQENKQLLTKIATQAKQEWEYLRKVVDDAVDFDDKYGFRVNRQMIEHYIEYVEYVEEVEDFHQQNDVMKVSAINPEIEEVYWNIEDVKKSPRFPFFFSLIMLIFLILVIMLTTQILTGANLQDPAPYAYPSPSPSPT